MLKFKYILLIALFVFIKGNFLFSEETSDSTLMDSIKLYEPIKKHGSLFLLNNDAHEYIHKSQIQRNDYLDYSDVLIQSTNFYPLHLSSLGLSNNVSFASSLYNQFSFNGINLSSPITQNTNLSQYSPEYTENIEIYTGMIAGVFSDNSTSTLINSPEINYNTSKPFFRFWGADAGEDYLALDGVFAQNIAPNLSMNFGFRSVAGKGVYTNDEVRSRSLRAGFRWNMSQNQNLSLIWMHNNHYLDEYGGISTNSIDENFNLIDDPIESISRFNSNSKRDIRNDFITNYSYISDDKNNALTAQFYLLDNFTYDYKNDVLHSSTVFNDRITYNSKKYGTNISLERKINNLFVKGKFELNNNFIENNYYTFFQDNYNNWNFSSIAYLRYDLDNISLSGGYRLSFINSTSNSNYGLKVNYKINSNNMFILDYSKTSILPLLTFSDLNSEINDLLYVRYLFIKNHFNLDLDIFYRNVNNQINYNISDNEFKASNNISNINYLGSNLNVNFRWLSGSKLFNYEVYTNFKLNLNYTEDTQNSILPLFHSFIDTYISIPRGRSNADIGFRLSYISENSGPTHFPDMNVFIDNNFTNQNGLARNEAYVRLRLGHAYLKISMINFLNRSYYYIPMYNSLPSNFRVTFNWTLI